VQFEGLSIATAMRPEVIHTEYWVIIDATTGEYVEALSYR
jgi:hypothetical protein